ncbi:MAG: copper oxidase [bacterium]|nr:copper oxidase [bacterium]
MRLLLATAGLGLVAIIALTAVMGTSRAQQMQMPMPETPAAGIKMTEEPIPDQGVPRATETTGGQPLKYRLVNGVKVFDLVARPVKWKIQSKYERQPEVWATAWTYNGTVPGPMIRVTEGDRVRVVFKNQLPAPISIHWHGLPVPNAMDGVAEPALTQKPIRSGETFTYEFVARPAGTFFYHSHVETDRQINIGLFAPFIIDPKRPSSRVDKDVVLMLNEWRIDPSTGKTWPAMPSMSEPNYFTINGKAFPDIPTITVKKGQRVRLRFVGAGQFLHPMHLHGMFFKIVATDGNPVPPAAQLTKDTLPITPGERYDVEFVADNPGKWALHCHVLHHVTNNGVEPGGLLMVVNVIP